MSSVILLMLTALLLTGCATSRSLVWNKPGSTLDDFRRDNYDCTQQSRTSWSAGGPGLWGLSFMLAAKSEAQQQANKLHKMCMEARGYAAHEKQENEAVQQ